MGGMLLFLTFLGVWFVVAAIMDWDWSLGTIDLHPAESTIGVEAVRWTICIIGLIMVFVGLGGIEG